MELVNAIESRRSIRKYEDKDVSDEVLLELIRCATLAPSGHNRQPWKFEIVRGELKDKIADTLYQKTIHIEGSTAPHTSGIIKEAPVLIVIYLTEYSVENYLYDILSIWRSCREYIIACYRYEFRKFMDRKYQFSRRRVKRNIGYRFKSHLYCCNRL